MFMRLIRDPVFVLLATMVLGWQVHESFAPPDPLPATAPDDIFSAQRAADILRRLYADNQPHVAGSANNQRLRDGIIRTLESAGYQPEVQKKYHCNPVTSACGPVENIIALRAGADPQHVILLTAHYDSVPAGAGVSDDGSGVAALLEIARMAAQHAQFNHDIGFLFSDAEESGLIGADAFASDHPLFQRIRIVINLEARGSEGASAMFESGERNRRMIRLLSNTLQDPVANSLAYEVYRRLPNDTDFSVYRGRGLTGFNFAFVGGVQNYHSRLDDLDHFDPGSLQHTGANAWSSLLALDQRSLERMIADEDAVYINLFHVLLLHYPVSSSAGIVLVLSVLLLVLVRKAFSQQIHFRQLLWSIVAMVFLLVAIPAAGWALSFPLGRWPDIHAIGHPYPWPGRIALWLTVCCLVLLTGRFITARASTGSVTMACWSLYAVFALGLVAWMPSASFLAILPLLGFLLGMMLDGLRWNRPPRLVFARLLGFLAAAYLGFYGYFMLELVTGFAHAYGLVLAGAMPAIAALPLLPGYAGQRRSGRAAPLVLLVLIVAAGIGHGFVPGFTADHPRAMNLLYREVAGETLAWMIVQSPSSSVDMHYARRQGFERVSLASGSGQARDELARPQPVLALPEVTLEQAGKLSAAGSDGPDGYHLQLQVPAEVEQLLLVTGQENGFTQVLVNGQKATDQAGSGQRVKGRQAGNGLRLSLQRPEPGPLRLDFQAAGQLKPFELRVRARFSLPDALLQGLLEDWPENAQPAFSGHRAERDQVFTITP